jgi:cell wall-associated NlpC family hydrolase
LPSGSKKSSIRLHYFPYSDLKPFSIMPLHLTIIMCLLLSFSGVVNAKVTHSKSVHKTHHVKVKHVQKKHHTKVKSGKKISHVKAKKSAVLTAKTTKPATNLKRRTKLMSEYASWKGTRYRLGGNSRKAIDCSALTRRLYQEAFAVNLPRTTSGQLTKGKKAKQRAMRIGDLVFFKTGRVQKHVGIYIGEDKFIHASRQKGVTISELSNPYWNQHLLAVRRVLPETAVR